MVTAPMLQRGVELTLPQMQRSQEISSERLFVDVPLSFKDDRRVYLGKEAIGLNALGERLRQRLLTRSDKQVFFRIDRALQVQHQIDVFDELKRAGVDNVGLATDPPPVR
jgi:biopolymer transport protein ExbD